ncbi:MAG TPA: trypsin-like peptidase domain-containing protein [Candidatus Polarisedimenticolia bacterium]|nr:trypsin-like peptidase domain-containing protein [Candidatus Polarisedimenticolia bacterium]
MRAAPRPARLLRAAPVAPALFAAVLLAGTPAPARATTRQQFENGVVGLSITAQTWDADRPWAKSAPQSRFALGVVLEGKQILTTAQMVADATLIEVEKLGGSTRVEAHVVRVDPEIDLAILGVDDAKFFSDLQPLPLAAGVPEDGSVQSVRWRTRQIEISTSRVSRIEVQTSILGSVDHAFLLVTTDLRGGGWAEPVFAEGKFIGLTVSQDDQVARVLPVDVVNNFLAMARASGGYAGFAGFGARWQVNEDPALSSWLGLPGPPRGVLITGANWGGSACGVLQARDILLSLDGHPIDGSGYYQHPRYGLLRFTNITTEGHKAGDKLPAEVWRDGHPVKLEMPLRAAKSEGDLIPDRPTDEAPDYVVAGGLVLRELDGSYIRSWGDDWRRKAPIRLQMWYWLSSKDQEPDHRRVVVLSGVLPSDYNVGYHSLSDTVVTSINGREIDSIADVLEAFQHPDGDFQRLTLEPNGQMDEITLDARTFEQASKEILESYRVPEAQRVHEKPVDLGPACSPPAGTATTSQKH